MSAAKGDVLEVSLEDLSPVMTMCVDAGREIVLTVTGNSMRPFLRHKRDQVVLVKADPQSLMPGDVPLYRRRDGRYVLHRVIERDDGEKRLLLGEREPLPTMCGGRGLHYTMLGDAQITREPGICPDQIVAVATAFIRHGHRYECAGARYQRYVRRWNRLLPVRMPIVKLCMLPTRIKNKVKRICSRIINRFR